MLFYSIFVTFCIQNLNSTRSSNFVSHILEFTKRHLTVKKAPPALVTLEFSQILVKASIHILLWVGFALKVPGIGSESTQEPEHL